MSVDVDADLLEPLADPGAETGIDLGLKDFAVLRGGRVIESPKFFRQMERKLRKDAEVNIRREGKRLAALAAGHAER